MLKLLVVIIAAAAMMPSSALARSSRLDCGNWPTQDIEAVTLYNVTGSASCLHGYAVAHSETKRLLTPGERLATSLRLTWRGHAETWHYRWREVKTGPGSDRTNYTATDGRMRVTFFTIGEN